MTADPSQLTRLLERAKTGDREARDDVLEAIYGELHVLAQRYLRDERRDHTLGTTGLVHEAYLRLLQGGEVPGASRGQLLAFIAKAMRHILIDYARARGSLKRGAGHERLELSPDLIPAPMRGEKLLALDEALQHLEEIAERKSRVVELRYFGGLSVEEVAGALDVSEATVKRDWQVARTWLFRELSGPSDDGAE